MKKCHRWVSTIQLFLFAYVDCINTRYTASFSTYVSHRIGNLIISTLQLLKCFENFSTQIRKNSKKNTQKKTNKINTYENFITVDNRNMKRYSERKRKSFIKVKRFEGNPKNLQRGCRKLNRWNEKKKLQFSDKFRVNCVKFYCSKQIRRFFFLFESHSHNKNQNSLWKQSQNYENQTFAIYGNNAFATYNFTQRSSFLGVRR